MTKNSNTDTTDTSGHEGLLLHGETTSSIISCSYRVYSRLGPGLPEKVYKRCTCYELTRRGKLMAYLRLSHKRVGLLINFDVADLKDGIRRKVW